MTASASSCRQGLTLMEVILTLVAITVLGIFALQATCNVVHRLVLNGSCGRNQSGIYAALFAYQENAHPGWPDARWKTGLPAGNGAIPSGEACARYTAGIFEILSSVLHDSMPSALFRCPHMPAPTCRPNPDHQPSATRPGTEWGWGDFKIPYAMDWSAPIDSGATRPLLADRHPDNHQGKRVVVCWADGHYGTIDTSPRTAVTGVTVSIGYGDGDPPARALTPTTSKTEDDGTPPDDLYDDAGDQIPGRPDANRMPGQGHPRRAIMW